MSKGSKRPGWRSVGSAHNRIGRELHSGSGSRAKRSFWLSGPECRQRGGRRKQPSREPRAWRTASGARATRRNTVTAHAGNGSWDADLPSVHHAR